MFYKRQKIKVPKIKFKGKMTIIRYIENGKLLLFLMEWSHTLFWFIFKPMGIIREIKSYELVLTDLHPLLINLNK